ncbi:MAG: hypothetical protein RRA94_16110 [Bacteroidota bacterium]|nr:hypothetical protein [Bacteroidota bacterium]
MKPFLTAALLFLASSASAQTYQPFYVGSWGVAPEFDYAPRTLYYALRGDVCLGCIVPTLRVGTHILAALRRMK